MKADVFNVHGKALSMICQYESSYHEEASKIYKAIYGTHHYKVAQTYHNLGTVHYYLGQYHEAKEYHEKALIIRKKIFGDEHAKVQGRIQGGWIGWISTPHFSVKKNSKCHFI